MVCLGKTTLISTWSLDLYTVKKGGMFDLLPLVLSGPDGVPQIFELPDEIVMRVKIKHPNLPELEKLKLEWFALPGQSNMLLEIGGIQFPCCPFSGKEFCSNLLFCVYLGYFSLVFL